MATEYNLKKNPITANRLYKLAKDLITESKEDREKALATFSYFKEKVDQGVLDENDNANATAQKCMIDCLKLAQESRSKTLKALDLIFKASKLITPAKGEDDDEGDASNTSFEDLWK